MYAACGCCLLLQMRIKFENMLLWGLIDGPKKPKNLQLHFHRLADELEVMWKGVRMWDANKEEWYTQRVALLLVIQDNRAFRDVAGMHDAGGWAAAWRSGSWLTGWRGWHATANAD